MKKILIFALLLISAVGIASAHDGDKKNHREMMKEITEFKIKFLAQEMELKGEQKEKFVDLYREMAAKRHEVMGNAFRAERKVKKMANASDADYKAAAETMAAAKAKDAELEKEYDAKFETFLTPKQMFRMKTAENDFRIKLEQMRAKDKNRHDKKSKSHD